MTPAQVAIVEHGKACEAYSAQGFAAASAGLLESAQVFADFAELHSAAAFAIASGVCELAA